MKNILTLFSISLGFSIFSSEAQRFNPQAVIYRGANFSHIVPFLPKASVDPATSYFLTQLEHFIFLIAKLEQRIQQLEETQQDLDKYHQKKETITLVMIQDEISRFCRESKFVSEVAFVREIAKQQENIQKLSEKVTYLEQKIDELSSKYKEIEIFTRIVYSNSLSLKEEFLEQIRQRQEEEQKRMEENSALGGKVRDVAYQLTALQLKLDAQVQALQAKLDAQNKKKMEDEAEFFRLDFSSATRPSSSMQTPDREPTPSVSFSSDELQALGLARNVFPVVSGPVVESSARVVLKTQKKPKLKMPKPFDSFELTGQEEWVEF